MNGMVYCLSFPSGRKYVGSTILPMKTRMHCHRQQSKISKTPVYQCWRLESEPRLDIIAVVPVDQLLERERVEAEKLGEGKLNVAPGGMGGGFPGNQHAKGRVMSLETRRQVSNTMKGNSHRSGLRHSSDAKARISETLKRTWAMKRQEALGVKNAT